ncbi:hypothetical protein ACI65C_006287 [Semiaphis heraclei]
MDNIHLAQERISYDTSKIAETIKSYFPELPANLKSIRLGKPNDRGPRPLKVFFSSQDIPLKLVSDFNKNARSLPPNSTLRSVTMARDRTPIERESIRLVYTELENRKKSGETDLTINYRDGFPFIVPLNRSSQARRHHASKSTFSHSKN